MAVTSYYPAKDADFVVWYNTFVTRLATYSGVLGLSVADMKVVSNDYEAIAYMVNQSEEAKADTQQRVKFKRTLLHGPVTTVPAAFPGDFIPAMAPTNAVPPGVITRLRKLVKQIKANTAYTPAMGKALGIDKGTTPMPVGIKPTGSVLALPAAAVEIKFVKRGFSGVQVESKRGGASGWDVLGSFVRSPLLDTRELLVPNQPEVRSYRLRYLDGNAPVGDVSDTLTTTTQV